MENSNKRVCER
uniref:Uncharacterized protein n=1 Tax=Arundo donax TaxID=35708 RepID=A0A0A8YWC3_ARUDO